MKNSKNGQGISWRPLGVTKKHLKDFKERLEKNLGDLENSLKDLRKRPRNALETSRYYFNYNIGNINASKLMILCTWPSDTNITLTIKTSYKLTLDLAKAFDMNSTLNKKSLQPFILIGKQNLKVSTGIELSSDNPDEFFEIDRKDENINNQNYQ
ncbi:hypothetical protein C1646_751592 [Rhizophagus diaphanus]|nr:hypothetical protein C1646_751592 [Rhizophagus diaphanus] [Rhizophagus sp. MUCL 43196]